MIGIGHTVWKSGWTVSNREKPLYCIKSRDQLAIAENKHLMPTSDWHSKGDINIIIWLFIDSIHNIFDFTIRQIQDTTVLNKKYRKLKKYGKIVTNDSCCPLPTPLKGNSRDSEYCVGISKTSSILYKFKSVQ